MELILLSVFSLAIVVMTIYSLIKVFNIAYNRAEISLRKYRFLVTSSIVTGLLVISILPFIYQKIFDAIF